MCRRHSLFRSIFNLVHPSESTSDGVHILEVQGSEHQVPRKENVIWNKNSISCKGLKYVAILILRSAVQRQMDCDCWQTNGTAAIKDWKFVFVFPASLRPRYFHLGGAFQWNIRERDQASNSDCSDLDGYTFASSCVAVRVLIGWYLPPWSFRDA
jgi:hypothetical protein